jgi:TonB family protein
VAALSSSAGLGFAPGAIPAAAAVPSRAASPAVAERAACLVPDREAQAVIAVQPDLPDTLRSNQWTGTTAVDVQLSANGSVERVSVAESSGNAWLDRIALETAAHTSFRPAVKNCDTTGGRYLYLVTFVN